MTATSSGGPGMTTGDRDLTGWAAACAEHALAGFARPAIARSAERAIATANAWAANRGSADACRDAAFEAHLAAREVQDAGHRALATAIRAASSAAASVDDSRLAREAAGYALEAVELNSAACEVTSLTASERRWQWARLDDEHRDSIFAAEPPLPAPAACVAVRSGDTGRN